MHSPLQYTKYQFYTSFCQMRGLEFCDNSIIESGINTMGCSYDNNSNPEGF